MKHYTRVEPTEIITVGNRFKRQVLVKYFRTDDDMEHEFTTFGEPHDSVAVVALTPETQAIVSHQFRPGRERYCYDLPGGGVEEGEDHFLQCGRLGRGTREREADIEIRPEPVEERAERLLPVLFGSLKFKLQRKSSNPD
jgi:hypothetical protein